MNLQELTDLVNGGESERVEFKKTTGQRSEAMRTVCAMLNGMGGFVLFGVTDRKQIVGQTVTGQTLEEVANELRRIEPPAFPDIEPVVLSNGLTVIALRVGGGGTPHTYDGRPYARNGPTTIQMPQGRYERLLLERMHGSARWENRPAVGVTLADLDHGEIVRTLDEAIRRRRVDEPGTRDVRHLLTGLQAWGRGTLKMAELTTKAGLPPPEIESDSREVVVRFRSTLYVAPTRVGHDLSSLQRRLLEVLARTGPAPISEILKHLDLDTPRRTVQANLQLLRHLDLIESTQKKGRAAGCKLRGVPS